jgi:hypothetical protein
MDIGSIPFDQYDQAAYEATSGIVDIPIGPDMAAVLAKMDFSVLGGDGTKYLEEAQLRAVPADPNLYADQGDTVSTAVQVYDRGVPAGAGIKVTLSEIGATQQTGLSQTTDSQGQVSFPLSTVSGVVTGLALQTGDNPTLPVTANGFDPQIYTYITFRVLPSDANVGAMAPTWDNVHNYVLSNWEAFAPCMDNWLRLGDEAQVQAYGPGDPQADRSGQLRELPLHAAHARPDCWATQAAPQLPRRGTAAGSRRSTRGGRRRARLRAAEPRDA